MEIKEQVSHISYFSYLCEHHIVFAPKYRRKVIYKRLQRDIGEIRLKVEAIKLEEDYTSDQISLKEHMGLFTSEHVKQGKKQTATFCGRLQL